MNKDLITEDPLLYRLYIDAFADNTFSSTPFKLQLVRLFGRDLYVTFHGRDKSEKFLCKRFLGQNYLFSQVS